jgi:hypothetical protein
MNNGDKFNYGLRVSTQSFTVKDVEILNDILKNKFNLITTLSKQNDIFYIYFYKSSMLHLSNIVKPYMIKSMHYKLNGF